jgi:hypothetical protein
MIIKFSFFLLFCLTICNVFGQKGKKNTDPKEKQVIVSDSIKLNEIWEISKKLELSVLPQFMNTPAKIDTAKIENLNKQLKVKSDSIAEFKSRIEKISKDIEDKNKLIQTLESNEKKVKQSQENFISTLSKTPKIDNKTFLELYIKYLDSQIAPSNLGDLKDFQLCSNLLDACDEMLFVDFSKLSVVKQKLEELKAKEQNMKGFPGLLVKYQRILPAMIGYEKKIVELNDHLERYYVTYKNAGSNDVDRIMYLQDYAKDFKDYPYLLKLIFEAMEKPNGTNLLKSKLK